jgi:glycine cleavage system H protein
MQDIGIDLFATKGLEYVLVIGYLFLLVVCWRFVRPRSSAPEEEDGKPADSLLAVRSGCHYHQGHAWASASSNGLMRVGVDDFVPKLLGPVTGVVLPATGALLEEGEPAWDVEVDGRLISILSPVDGVVVARNTELLESPDPLTSDPYGRGWVMEVSVRNPVVAARNLLSGRLAQAWRDELVAQVQRLSNGNDIDLSGGITVETGLARALAPDAWDDLARAFLLTDEAPAWLGAEGEVEEEGKAQTV